MFAIARWCVRFGMAGLLGCSSTSDAGLLPAVDAGGSPHDAMTPPVDGGATDAASLDASAPRWVIAPGSGIGDIRIGDSYGAIAAKLGKAVEELGANHLVMGRWPEQKLEIGFASAAETSLTADAIVLALSLRADADAIGAPRPGATRDQLVTSLGPPVDEINSILYWTSGASAQLDGNGVATQVAVFSEFTAETTAEEMTPSKGNVSIPLEVEPSKVSAVANVDMHLHPGRFGRIPPAARKTIVSSTPPFTQIYAPATSAAALDPFAPFVGIKAQTGLASVHHAVLFAVYAQKTTGWFANEDVEAILTDPRNVAQDGLPWAFGLASINFFDGYVRADGTVDAAVARGRLDALASYFEKRRDLFIGIKLAHAHQQVAFDDARYLGVYDIAAKYGVPIYLHTGFSPFENAKNERAYYDPQGLRNTILNNPKVAFILGHTGQGDALAVEHSLAMAVELPNVYLEVSTLSRPILRDLDGNDVPADPAKPQLPYVLEQIKARGLVDKTIFGTDGPQYAGMIRNYVTTMTTTMRSKAFTDDEVARVMSRNFFAVFFRVRR